MFHLILKKLNWIEFMESVGSTPRWWSDHKWSTILEDVAVSNRDKKLLDYSWSHHRCPVVKQPCFATYESTKGVAFASASSFLTIQQLFVIIICFFIIIIIIIICKKIWSNKNKFNFCMVKRIMLWHNYSLSFSLVLCQNMHSKIYVV